MSQVPFETTPAATSWQPVMHDHVRVPDGREGKVIGFYRRDTDTALVMFAVGDCSEFPMSDIQPSWIGWDGESELPAPEGRKTAEQLYAEIEHTWTPKRRWRAREA
jgi:hypothetical protein